MALVELESEFLIEFATGTKLRLKFKREDDVVTLTRDLIVGGSTINTLPTTVTALESDASKLLQAADYLRDLGLR
jgi:hypothetical protein